MVRTQIQLSKVQYERLRQESGRRGVSMAEIIREGVERVLASPAEPDIWTRARAAAGRFRDRDGLRDVGERHDRYLVKTWGKRG